MAKQVICCDALKKMRDEQYFFMPVRIDIKTGMVMTTDTWTIRMPKRTRAGNFSRMKGMTVFLNFCPFCGTDIQPEARHKSTANPADVMRQ